MSGHVSAEIADAGVGRDEVVTNGGVGGVDG